MRTGKRRQLTIGLTVYLIFTLLIGIANLLNAVGERNGTLETLEPIAGLLMGFLAFPVFCIGLPCGSRGAGSRPSPSGRAGRAGS
jgi:hypothetical protein